MRTASAPLLAVPITWMPGDFSNRETNALRQMVESSATTTRMGEERLPGRSEGFVALVMVGNALTFFCVASPGSALLGKSEFFCIVLSLNPTHKIAVLNQTKFCIKLWLLVMGN
jgi:hypothetical protein